jgi:hypothetical protein
MQGEEGQQDHGTTDHSTLISSPVEHSPPRAVADVIVSLTPRALLFSIVAIAGALSTTGFKMAGRGENRPTVQSAFDGAFYVRSVPNSDYGTEGKTQVFRVRSNGDELVDEYRVYMRGELYLGWSPIAGKWCLIHLEPERITSDDDFEKVGTVSRLAFYMGGKEIMAYTGKDLEKMGLKKRVQTLVHRGLGQFMVHGIQQVPGTNHYVFLIEKTAEQNAGTETISLDITTGRIFSDESGRSSAEPKRSRNGS